MDTESNRSQLIACGHIFHKSCINKFFDPKHKSDDGDPKYPNCRSFFTKPFVQDTMCYYHPSESVSVLSVLYAPVNRSVSILIRTAVSFKQDWISNIRTTSSCKQGFMSTKVCKKELIEQGCRYV